MKPERITIELPDSESHSGHAPRALEVQVEEGNCWHVLNKAHTNVDYAVMSVNGVMVTVARYLYILKKNPNLTRDSYLRRVCGHRWCVNPDHMEEVERRNAIK